MRPSGKNLVIEAKQAKMASDELSIQIWKIEIRRSVCVCVSGRALWKCKQVDGGC